MKNYISKIIRRDLSKLKHKNGVLYETYIKDFKYKEKYNNEDLFSLLKEDKYIDITNNYEIKLKYEFFITQEYLEFENDLYNYNYIKNLFKEEANHNILTIYKLIIDFDELNYTEISKLLFSLCSIKLDIKQVAHYCKELKNYNLINSEVNSLNNNEKIISKKTISYDLNYIHSKEENNFFNSYQNINITNPYKILDLNEDETYIMQNDKIQKFYYDNRFSFVIDDCNIQNNILFHLKINEKGLTLNSITLLLGMLGREKSIGRILTNMTKEGQLKHKAIREGKKYEYVYLINTDKEIDKSLLMYYEYFSNKLVKYDKLIKKEDSENIDNYQLVDLNNRDYLFIIEFIKINEKYSHICKKYDLKDNIYQIKKDVLLDFFNSNSEFNANKSFSNISYNRYLYCLNKIDEKKIISSLDLRHLIMEELEKDKEYVIDRKTLKKVLSNLENFGLIKILEFELTMTNKEYSYQKNKEIKQSKLFLMRRDIQETEEILKKIESELTNTKSKKLQTKSIPIEKKQIEFNYSTLIISNSEKNIRKFLEIINKVINKPRNTESLKSYFFILKKNAFINKNLSSFFNNNYVSQELYLYKLLQDNKFDKVIIPNYLFKNIKTNKYGNKKEEIKTNTNITDLLDRNFFDTYMSYEHYDIKENIKLWEKKGLNDLNYNEKIFSSFYYNINEKDKEIKSKVLKDNEDEIFKSMIFSKRKRGRNSNFDKKSDLYHILSNIFFNPKISFKKLRNSFLSNHEACINFLQYFYNQGFLYLNKKSENEISFQLDDSISDYLKNT